MLAVEFKCVPCVIQLFCAYEDFHKIKQKKEEMKICISCLGEIGFLVHTHLDLL